MVDGGFRGVPFWPGGGGGRPRALIQAKGLAWWTGGQVGGARVGGGCKTFGSGGVGGRDTGARDGANFATCRIFVSNAYKKKKNLKDALWGGGGTPPELAWWTGGYRIFSFLTRTKRRKMA